MPSMTEPRRKPAVRPRAPFFCHHMELQGKMTKKPTPYSNRFVAVHGYSFRYCSQVGILWDQVLQLKHSRSLLTASSFLAMSRSLHRRSVEVEQHWPTNLIVSGFFTPSLSSLSHAILDSTRNDYPVIQRFRKLQAQGCS